MSVFYFFLFTVAVEIYITETYLMPVKYGIFDCRACDKLDFKRE